MVGLTSSTFAGPRNILQPISKFPRELATCSLGCEVSALSEMVGHVMLSKDCFGPFAGLDPRMVGLEDCEGLFTRLQTQKMIADKSPARHFSSTQRAL